MFYCMVDCQCKYEDENNVCSFDGFCNCQSITEVKPEDKIVEVEDIIERINRE